MPDLPARNDSDPPGRVKFSSEKPFQNRLAGGRGWGAPPHPRAQRTRAGDPGPGAEDVPPLLCLSSEHPVGLTADRTRAAAVLKPVPPPKR